MAKRKLKLVDKIILIAAPIMAALLILFWLSRKRTNRDYILPAEHTGWVQVKYNVPGAPALPYEEGSYRLTFDSAAYLVTSTELEAGWGRDRYFRQTAQGLEEIPLYLDEDGEKKVFIHRHEYKYFSFEYLLGELPVGVDTTMWEGTQIEKKDSNQVSYTPGELTLESFYVSGIPRNLLFNPPKLENDSALLSTEDRMLEVK